MIQRAPLGSSVTAEHPAATDPVRGYRDLRVWQEAMDLAEATYHATERFPKHERYGLVTHAERPTRVSPTGAGRVSPKHLRLGGTHAGRPSEKSPSPPCATPGSRVPSP